MPLGQYVGTVSGETSVQQISNWGRNCPRWKAMYPETVHRTPSHPHNPNKEHTVKNVYFNQE